MIPVTGIAAHDAALLAGEQTRQISMKTATTQAAADAAHITFYRAALASARANGMVEGQGEFLSALRSLGVWA